MQQRSRRRTMQWFSKFAQQTNLASGGQANLALYNTSDVNFLFIKGATITRVILDLIWHPQTLTTASYLFWGLVIGNAEVFAAGSFPDADDMSDRAGWLGRGMLKAKSGNLSDGSQDPHVQLDLRSQRVMRTEEDDFRLILDASASGITGDYTAFVRTLIKLPP